MDVRVLLEKGSLHAPLFGLKFTEPVLGEGFALAAPLFLHHLLLLLHIATSRALVTNAAVCFTPGDRESQVRCQVWSRVVRLVVVILFDL